MEGVSNDHVKRYTCVKKEIEEARELILYMYVYPCWNRTQEDIREGNVRRHTHLMSYSGCCIDAGGGAGWATGAGTFVRIRACILNKRNIGMKRSKCSFQINL